MAARDSLIQTIGKSVRAMAKSKSSEWWYTPHMAAAARAIAERVPLVDLILEVRDARIPVSSECLQLRKFPSASRIIVLNKADLADRSQTKEWLRCFEGRECLAFGVNSHNRDSIREFLTFVQARVREIKRKDNNAITLMLVGIPNVGKSALANSLHQVGRISAAEKGRLKHCVVTSQPGETKSISSLKIGSHPNIYVLDTPSVLPPEVIDDEVCSKLAVTGAIKDSVVGETKVAEYLLSILNLGEEYKKWGKLSGAVLTKQKKQYPTDHTQDFMVNNVRCALFDLVSHFDGEDVGRLIQKEFEVLRKVFHLPPGTDESTYSGVAKKLLNLYSTGRLGHYTLDPV